MVDRAISGEMPIDHFITHRFKACCGLEHCHQYFLASVTQYKIYDPICYTQGVDTTNQAVETLHGGACLRAVVEY